MPSSGIHPSMTSTGAPSGLVGARNGAAKRISPKITAANATTIASQPFQVGTQISFRLKSMRAATFRLLRQRFAGRRKNDFFHIHQRPAKRLLAANRDGLVAFL